jgi:hypothetical protein
MLGADAVSSGASSAAAGADVRAATARDGRTQMLFRAAVFAVLVVVVVLSSMMLVRAVVTCIIVRQRLLKTIFLRTAQNKRSEAERTGGQVTKLEPIEHLRLRRPGIVCSCC